MIDSVAWTLQQFEELPKGFIVLGCVLIRPIRVLQMEQHFTCLVSDDPPYDLPSIKFFCRLQFHALRQIIKICLASDPSIFNNIAQHDNSVDFLLVEHCEEICNGCWQRSLSDYALSIPRQLYIICIYIVELLWLRSFQDDSRKLI